MGIAEPQFSSRAVMRPYSTFKTVYGGVKNAYTDYILLSPNGEALDPAAGKLGYASELVRGLAVPQGARVVIKLPMIYAVYSGRSPTEYEAYAYRFIWRSRTLGDYQRGNARQYHDPTQRFGSPLGLAATVRWPIAGFTNAVVYNQSEGSELSDVAVQHLRIEEIAVHAFPTFSAVNPSGAASVVEQGVTTASIVPSYLVYETAALSDELLIAVHRASTFEGSALEWDFDSEDQPFGAFFSADDDALGGFADRGVLVEVGSAP